MPINIVVPEVGESIVDARVARWLKKPGDAVAAGEALVELETDKVDVEVSAPQAGVLETIARGDGSDVKIGEVLGTMGAAAGTAGATGPASPAGSTGPTTAAGAATGGAGESVAATPSARRTARERDVGIASVKSSGPRVTRTDVEQAAAPTTAATPALRPAARANDAAATPAAATPETPAAATPAPAAPASAAPASTTPVAAKPVGARPAPAADRGDARETRTRMSKRRATIARRLVEAQQTAAMLTTFNEVDMSSVMALRDRHKESFKTKYGVGLGVASFFVKAAVVALQDFPRLNAEIQGDEIVLKHYYDIGVAVGAAEGLVVPVLRAVDRLSFSAIESGIRAFAKKAQDGTLSIDDLRGGTFSVTNGGVYGSLMSTPILNPPQVGILGLHTIKDRPIGVGGQIVLRPMMYLALTYDHRIVDGSEAVQFLVRVKALIEDPASLLF